MRAIVAVPGRAASARPERATSGGRGFSLVELLVGILLLEVGVLALASTAAGMVRMTTLGGREGAASVVASARLEALRLSACAPHATPSGTDRTGPFEERWSLVADGTERLVEVAVSWADGPRTRSARLETAVECAP